MIKTFKQPITSHKIYKKLDYRAVLKMIEQAPKRMQPYYRQLFYLPDDEAVYFYEELLILSDPDN